MRKILLAWCACLAISPDALTNTLRETYWIEQAASGLDPRVLETLPRLRGTARQLLALRAYLRAGDSLAAHWSWTQQQLASYPASDEGRAAASDIDAVEQAFARANPGFTAHANRMPRSLDIQVDHWNENPEVGMVARALQVALEHQFPADAPAPAAHRAWDAQGWTSKLHAAVLASGKPFVGPLLSPYEPWHYVYISARR